jgi:hypothetical protein
MLIVMTPIMTAAVTVMSAIGIIMTASIIAIVSAIWVVIITPVRIMTVSVVWRAVIVSYIMYVFRRRRGLCGKSVEIEGSRCLRLPKAAGSKNNGGSASYTSQDFHRLALPI